MLWPVGCYCAVYLQQWQQQVLQQGLQAIYVCGWQRSLAVLLVQMKPFAAALRAAAWLMVLCVLCVLCPRK